MENWRRGTGILNNELYVGQLVWNRQRFAKDPQSGRRQARINPEADWIIEEVPEFRIIDQALWAAVKQRQQTTRRSIASSGGVRSERARRPRYLLSGLLTCGECGGGYILVGKKHYGCANSRNRGTCNNRLSIRRDVVEETVLSGLCDRLVSPDLIAEYVDAYRREFARLQREASVSERTHRSELAKINRQIDNIVEAVKRGLFAETMNAELRSLEERKLRLEEALAQRVSDQPALHPRIAENYRRKVADLIAAFNQDDGHTETAEVIRSLISSIRLNPCDGRLIIELEGELAAILALSSEQRSKNKTRQITLVAGARCQLCRTQFVEASFEL